MPTDTPSFLYSLETRGELHPWTQREWLLTNGLGGFANSSIVGCNTRRYHGLLVAALKPPVGRFMALSRIGELVFLDGNSNHTLEFSVNQFRNTFHPRGDQYLRRFELGKTARWEYEVEGVTITKEVLLVWQKNIVGVRYTVDAGRERRVQLQLLPFVSLRDFHALRTASSARFRVSGMGQEISVEEHGNTVYLKADNATVVERGDWWYGHTYAVESERGQDDTEDLYTPGSFYFQTDTGVGSVTLWAGMEAPGLRNWDEEVAKIPEAKAPAVAGGASPSLTLRRLAHAAADFVVQRKQPDGPPGSTIIAGYPWFSDWGRDTMISLPGLLLATGRFAEAAQVLSVFAQYVSEGMIPNVFNDYTNEPDYNTVDASLWFVHAAHEYKRQSGDAATFNKKLLPACKAIIEGYRKGTRYNIGMDPEDFLIHAGDKDTQLTWMDAKCGGIAFTPRHGKPVEINALWYNALKLMGEEKLAASVAASFVKQFYISPFRGLSDVVYPTHKDTALRPNQIFAVSLPHSPLDREQQHSVVDLVQRELLTPMGLRSLAKSDGGYKGHYSGPQMQRDAAYHNGTVWGWLIGPFLEAYLRVHDSSVPAVAQAKLWLEPMIDLMSTGGTCVGQIGEIFEGDAPHRPVGCFAQAWSVAEVLRIAVKLGM